MSKYFLRLKLYWRILVNATVCLAERFLHPGAAYLVLTPEHGNLGDHAIALAEKELFEKEHIKVIEVTGKELQRRRELGLLRLMNGRPIFVNGGGNLGTLWFPVEQLLRALIQKNPRSPICIFPSTIFFEDSDFGRREKLQSALIFNRHHHLTVYLRERTSFQIAEELFDRVSVKLTPDMAMMLNYCEPHVSRHGCILSLRRDIEKTRSAEQESRIVAQVEYFFGGDYLFLDMDTDCAIPICQREQALSSQLDSFRHAELVITDRLHGMAFCAITGTPCIAIESKSHKIRGCYEWIKNLDYICLCEDYSRISELIPVMPKDKQSYDNSELMPLFDRLGEEMKTIIRRR